MIRKIRKYILFSLIFYFISVQISFAKNISQYEAQAILIRNITKYVKFENVKNINIFSFCLFAKTPLYSELIKLGTKHIFIKNKNDDISDCHVIFIDDAYIGNISQIIFKTAKKSILTISDRKNFTNDRGGIIEFKINSSKVLITINVKSLKSSSLILDNKLLKIAKIIN